MWSMDIPEEQAQYIGGIRRRKPRYTRSTKMVHWELIILNDVIHMAKKQQRAKKQSYNYDGFTWREGNKWKYRTYSDYDKFCKELDMFLYGNGYKISDTKTVVKRGRLVIMRVLVKNSPSSKVYYVPRN